MSPRRIVLLLVMSSAGFAAELAAASTTPVVLAANTHAQHPEMSRVMPLGVSDAPLAARLVFAAGSESTTAEARDDGDDEDATAFLTTSAPSELGNTIKNTVLKIVLYILLAVKVNTLLFLAVWFIKRILSRPKPSPTPSPS